MPDVAKSVFTLLESHPRHRPDHDGLGSLAHYLGLARTDAIQVNHLLLAFRKPEDLRALDTNAAAALARQKNLAGPKLGTLALELLGWGEWGIWKDVALSDVLTNPHEKVMQLALGAVRDAGQLDAPVGRLEENSADADAICIRMARGSQPSRFTCHIIVELARRAKSGSTALTGDALIDVLSGRLGDL